jgi:large subunit ribosomal protein L15
MSVLHKLPAMTTKGRRRIGRGYGSKLGGHTVGRGTKGQNSRVGGGVSIWFEGGQLPLVRRFPWLRGKGRLNSLNHRQEVNMRDVIAKNLTKVTPETLMEAGLVQETKTPIRLIGIGDVTQKLTVSGLQTSQPVKTRIEKAGGSVSA